MAFWNAPVAVENHQWHAAKAALAIRKAVVTYNATPSVQALLALHDIPPIALRIGLASGPACVGNMGSSDRFDYTVIGETVNTAARTEATCKHVAHDILLAGKLHTATQNLAVLSAGRAAMKGKSQAEEIHALISDETEALTTGFSELRREHDHLIAKLVDKPSAGGRATIQQLLDEVALHHPICASYLRALAGRSADFATVTPPRGRE
jgi:adenylate cyclase